jgi:hypothetical protein
LPGGSNDEASDFGLTFTAHLFLIQSSCQYSKDQLRINHHLELLDNQVEKGILTATITALNKGPYLTTGHI